MRYLVIWTMLLFSDGASVPRTVMERVILPQLGPALVSVLLFNIIFVLE